MQSKVDRRGTDRFVPTHPSNQPLSSKRKRTFTANHHPWDAGVLRPQALVPVLFSASVAVSTARKLKCTQELSGLVEVERH